jgi:peptide/nickel transport system substrate-binding protein
MRTSFNYGVAVAALAVMFVSAASATPLRIARSGDSLTMDPHSQNEGPTHNMNHQIYEPLVRRAANGDLVPTLATSWGILASDPKIWEIKLRPNVKFHDGGAFSADDVVFSLKRAMAPTSDHKGLLTAVDDVVKVDDTTVHIKTKGPSPLLIQNLTNLFMMSKAWSEKNNVLVPQNFVAKEETFAVRNTNGTGAFMLVSREPDVKTVMKRNDNYWGKGTYPVEVSELTFSVIKSAPTRVAALLSGEVDFVQDVPVQDIARLKSQPRACASIPAREPLDLLRHGRRLDKELKGDDVKGKNPFADKRVRQAMNIAIDREAIQKRRDARRVDSLDRRHHAPPFVNGWTRRSWTPSRRVTPSAKALLAEAGYPERLRR